MQKRQMMRRDIYRVLVFSDNLNYLLTEYIGFPPLLQFDIL